MTLNISVHYRFKMMKFAILQQIYYVNLKKKKKKKMELYKTEHKPRFFFW